MKLKLFFASMFCLFIFKTTDAQTVSGLYVETTKFKQYMATNNGVMSNEYRYDDLHQLVLNFVNHGDSLVFAILYDYDANGNRIGHTTLSFTKEKGSQDRYLLTGAFNQKKFAEAIKKIMDLLDKE